ncbi:MAG: preprotein translocase subunit YajC [Bacillota bacterium]|uniref:Protein translocase subunit yajC n=2 Tax=Carboxydocella TaxID=178898 RepID=A0A1T4PH04_9FIRM|nr:MULTISPECIES: preprotein translocase subunit YajC [Carboxydocella]AVX21469.1 protein translocase subunit yajC [Carboxydocella thermautotrophica]AVX31957.1 protein translocase subunit yajC [Carboxydocella thermautotrophica]SJZ90802.1 protein translocase subunit yajC [Carboxydocella sporoproducens DSM 16521]GAW29214.1 preprotein translocase subunit YajC [Carboxydocella sp. ULO1]GAW32600.1 preprotein translocase subunit YajC [Carboxydocella sp. JDF658]
MNQAQLMNIGSLVLFFVLFYFLLIRPQQKQAKQKKQLLESLQPKDKVVTIGGICGTIMRVKEKTVMLKVADKVEIEILKSAIAYKEGEEKE